MTKVNCYSELNEFTQTFKNLNAAVYFARSWSKSIDHCAVVTHNGKFFGQYGHRVDMKC